MQALVLGMAQAKFTSFVIYLYGIPLYRSAILVQYSPRVEMASIQYLNMLSYSNGMYCWSLEFETSKPKKCTSQPAAVKRGHACATFYDFLVLQGAHD